MKASGSTASSNGSAQARSWVCPGVSITSTGLPSASTTTCILVVSPPRERPIACSPFFSCAGAVLMSAHDGGVDHHVFVVVITRQQLENTLENSALRPSIEALVDDLPIAEALRQIAPRDTSSISEENRFDEQSIIRRTASDMAFAAGQKILDPIPLIVAQPIASHPSAPPQADRLRVTQLLIRESPGATAASCSPFDSDPFSRKTRPTEDRP